MGVRRQPFGKTECGAVETVWRARGIHPYRENRPDTFGWVVSVSREVQRDVAQKKILYYLNPEWIADVVMVSGKSGSPEGGVIDYIAVKNVFGGISRIGFKSAEAGREKFQGASLDYVWFDEEPPEDIYNECRMRVVDKRGDIYGTMTPLKGLTFVYNKIYLNAGNDPEIWSIFMEWKDNPYLDEGEINAVSAAMSPEELESRRYGRFSSSKGMIYPEFDETVHVIEPFDVPREWYDNISIDPGLHNPLACLFSRPTETVWFTSLPSITKATVRCLTTRRKSRKSRLGSVGIPTEKAGFARLSTALPRNARSLRAVR